MSAPRRNRLTATVLALGAASMVGLSFASVPLYRLFCDVTGYQGTTRRADAGADRMLDREVVVRFDGNVSGLSWRFGPDVPQIHARLGETVTVNFFAENTGPTETTGTAAFNVQPDAAGAYFNKIECFCFSEQKLRPGERIEMPVQFFVSPDMMADRTLQATRTITLSYTFFPVADAGSAKAGQGVAQADDDAGAKRL